jgi:hypothetical protein
MNILGLTGKVPGQRFPHTEETDVLEIHMLLQKIKGTLTCSKD